MPRRATYSSHLIARIRAWFGLRQDQMAQFLDVSADVVRAWESGRSLMPAEARRAVDPLRQQVPLTASVIDGYAFMEPAEQAAATIFDVAEIDFRRYECEVLAFRARYEAERLEWRLWVAQRWEQALPLLLELHLAPADADAETVERLAWRTRWLRRQARPLDPKIATRWHLLRARATGLEAQAAALAALLPPPPNRPDGAAPLRPVRPYASPRPADGSPRSGDE